MSHAPQGPDARSGGPSFAPPDQEDQAQIKDLEAQIADLAAQLAESEAQAKELLMREAAGQGVYAAEIFRLKQRKMTLATEIQHRKVRINAILLGM